MAATTDKSSALTSSTDSGRDQQLSPEATSVLSSVAAAVAAKTPVIDEEKNDIMRAGLLSKVFDHIALLFEDWFVGVRPRTSVIPCPFCSEDIPCDLAQLQRTFSNNPRLLTPDGRGFQVNQIQQYTSDYVVCYAKCFYML